ncbi:hypothetical protein J2T17_002161 [Paenibacillus mucilaginosus]
MEDHKLWKERLGQQGAGLGLDEIKLHDMGIDLSPYALVQALMRNLQVPV